MSERGVLLVGNFLSHARGHRHYCEDLAEHLEAHHWEVARTSASTGRFRKLVDMIRTTWNRRHDYSVAHVDLYSGSAFAWAEAVCFELRRLRKPFVITMHGGNLPQFARRWPRRTHRLLSSAHVVTSPSAYLSQEMARYIGDVTILPNGIDIARYPFKLRASPRRRLVWLRAFHATYNPVLAIDVLAQLCHRDPDTTLRMIGPDRGDGSLDRVRERARELDVLDRLELVGAVANTEVANQLAAADVLLNTTNVDNTPVSILEAMGCGLCVVSTSVGGIPYMIEHERDALLVPPRDPESMSRAVERVFSEPSLAAKLSNSGRQRALACDWERVVYKWDELFLRVAARA